MGVWRWRGLVEDSASGMVVACDDVAAPAKWADRAAVAGDCLARIAPFFPATAANAILDGVAAILAAHQRR